MSGDCGSSRGAGRRGRRKGALSYGSSVWESCTDTAFPFVWNELPCGHTRIVSHPFGLSLNGNAASFFFVQGLFACFVPQRRSKILCPVPTSLHVWPSLASELIRGAFGKAVWKNGL